MPDLTPPTNHTEINTQKLGLTFNWQDWLPYFEDTAIPDAKKREMIETLWQIVVAFVDLGFDLNPNQQVGQQSCGQNIDLKDLLESAVLKSPTTKKANEHVNKGPRSRPNNRKHKEPTP